MGSIITRPRKDGSISYQAMVKIPGSKAAVRTCDTQEDAQTFIDRIEMEVRSLVRTRHEKAQRELLKKQREEENSTEENQALFNEDWLKTTLKNFCKSEDCVQRHLSLLPALIRYIGDVKHKELKKKWIKAYIARMRATKTKRGKPFAYGTLVGHIRMISSAIRWRAEELEIPLPRLPFSTDLLPKNWETKRNRRLSRNEEIAIIARIRSSHRQSRHHWRLLIRLALETGARLQEMILAEWSEFDLERRYWTIPDHHNKTGVTRVVPLSKIAMRTMKMLKLLADPGNPRVFHLLGTPASVSSVFHRMIEKLGMDDFVFHDLRHEAISRMVLYKRQLSVFEIMGIVGHSSIQMLKRYTNLRGDELALKIE